MKMPFPIHVTVTLEKEGTVSCPPEEIRGKMSAALKDYFSEKLEEEPHCYTIKRGPKNPKKGTQRGPNFEQKGDQKGTQIT